MHRAGVVIHRAVARWERVELRASSLCWQRFEVAAHRPIIWRKRVGSTLNHTHRKGRPTTKQPKRSYC